MIDQKGDNMKHRILTLLIGMCVQSHASALESLDIPKGLSLPSMKGRTTQSAHQSMKFNKKQIGKNLAPPVQLVERHSRHKKHSEITTIKLVANGKLANTEHMAVTLKNAGFRLYKKRTRIQDKSWTYWLKTKSGEPLYKVELNWVDKNKHSADLSIWSWDDKTRFNIEQRSELVKLFGRVEKRTTQQQK